jgi:hypothetical protein
MSLKSDDDDAQFWSNFQIGDLDQWRGEVYEVFQAF